MKYIRFRNTFFSLIWDYDTAIGQVNATFPYNFDEAKLHQEIANVDKILDLGENFAIPMTFACVGFAAEPGTYPYHVPEQIKKICAMGHEIASHSWRHEWFPALEREQIKRSLSRSKYILEKSTQQVDAVKGFVPPFSRPMSWYSQGAVSLGDRFLGPWYPGASLGSLIKIVGQTGYTWIRVAYRPLWRKFLAKHSILTPQLFSPWPISQGIVCVPHHYTGFDRVAQDLVKRAIENKQPLVIVGHPSGLTRSSNENLNHLTALLQMISDFQQAGQLEASTIQNLLNRVDGNYYV